jgi:hypothetical protein
MIYNNERETKIVTSNMHARTRDSGIDTNNSPGATAVLT